MAAGHVAMGICFFPRGGSAQVVRYLASALKRADWSVRVFTGSLGSAGDASHAATFFGGLEVKAMDYTPAGNAAACGKEPMDQPVPMHASFEDRPGAPDRIMTSLTEEQAERQVAAWERAFAEGGADRADVFHLHHLTPQHDAAARRWPNRPLVGQLHGTELKMLDDVRDRMALAQRLSSSLADLAARADAGDLPTGAELCADDRALLGTTRWPSWRHGEAWQARLVSAARRCQRLVAASQHARDEAVRLLGVDPSMIELIPNGVDIDRFDARHHSAAERLSQWRRWLVQEPRGWDTSGGIGSIRYTEGDLTAFVDAGSGAPLPVLLFVGRFLRFKRIPLLLRAYARARQHMEKPAPLVIWGGHPGEWEDEHPYTLARRAGIPGVFFVGWRGHDDLPEGLSCSDVMVAPSTDEPFGQVYIEAMACGIPVIATRSGGPLSFVNVESRHPNGWLVEPDDEVSLARALVSAVNDAPDRAARGANAYRFARSRYSWEGIAQRFAELYEEVRRQP